MISSTFVFYMTSKISVGSHYTQNPILAFSTFKADWKNPNYLSDVVIKTSNCSTNQQNHFTSFFFFFCDSHKTRHVHCAHESPHSSSLEPTIHFVISL